MADYTITPDDQGAYEIPLAAGVEKTVEITLTGRPTVNVVHHSGDNPIYIGVNRAAVAADSGMRMLMPGSWLELTLSAQSTRTIHLISTGDAVVSVTRS